MFEGFLKKYPAKVPFEREPSRFEEATAFAVRRTYGGCVFGDGIYRIIDESENSRWNKAVEDVFPNFRDQIDIFGFDWLGRAFSSGRSDVEVLLFEPGTREVLEIPVSVFELHEVEFVAEADAALAKNFFDSWLKHGNRAPEYSECIGYKVPLFLGGADELENLEVSDLDVYWNLIGQLT